MTTSARKTRKTIGHYDVKVNGLVVDVVKAVVNREWIQELADAEHKYIIFADEDGRDVLTDDRSEIRKLVADMIREIRNDAIEAQIDRDNDELDDAIEALKDSGKASKALDVLRAAGLI